MIHKSLLILTFALTAAFAGPAVTEAMAHDITVSSPWSRATSTNAPNGAAFMMIHNAGATDDRLVSAATDKAERVELHTHRMEEGVMKMRQVDVIDVPAGGEAELKPGGLHVMMFGLRAPLGEGETFPLELTFEHGGTQTVEVTVMKAGAKMPMMGGGHGGGHNSGHGGSHGDGHKMHGK